MMRVEWTSWRVLSVGTTPAPRPGPIPPPLSPLKHLRCAHTHIHTTKTKQIALPGRQPPPGGRRRRCRDGPARRRHVLLGLPPQAHDAGGRGALLIVVICTYIGIMCSGWCLVVGPWPRRPRTKKKVDWPRWVGSSFDYVPPNETGRRRRGRPVGAEREADWGDLQCLSRGNEWVCMYTFRRSGGMG